jgi:drug/metabolite transporter (DMT)-like permease
MVLLSYISMCFIFGTTFLLIKTGLNLGWSPFLFSSLRFVLAGVILLLFVSLKKKETITFRNHMQILIISLLMTTIPFGALYYAEQYIPSGEAAIFTSTSPIFILAFNFLLKGKRIFIRQISGAVICILGVFLLVSGNEPLTTGHNLWPKILMICAEAAFSYATIQSKTMIDKAISPAKFNALQMLYGGILLFLLALITREPLTVPTAISGYFLLIYFVLVASIFANTIFFWLIKKTNPFFPSTWTYVSPMIAVAMGWLFLNEQLGVSGLTGAFLVIFGVILANVAFKRKSRRTADYVLTKNQVNE